jgi:hypothetical protein
MDNPFTWVWRQVRGNAIWDAIKWLWAAGGAFLSVATQATVGYFSGHQNMAALLITAYTFAALLVAAIIISKKKPRSLAVEPQGPSQPIHQDEESRVIDALVVNAKSRNIPSPAREALKIVYSLPGITYHDLREKLLVFQDAEEKAIKPLMRDGLIEANGDGTLYPKGISEVLREVEKRLKLP